MASGGGGLRALTRDAVRARIADAALVLFDRDGFEETTVDDVAAAVGISPRSFFRYFPAKEDAVIGDLVLSGTQFRDDVTAQLVDHPPWEALRRGMRTGAARMDADPQRWLRTMRVITRVASLRSRNLEKHLAWSDLLVPEITGRPGRDGDLDTLTARTLVGMAFACLDAALATWTEEDAARPLCDVLDDAFAAHRRTGGG